MSAMVAGAIVPDIPVFLGLGHSYVGTHSWLGVVLVNPVLAVVALGIWFGLVRDPVVDILPLVLRERLAPTARLPRSRLPLVPVAAMAGAATHVGWDLFTHSGRWGVRQIEWLQTRHAGLVGFEWMQHLSGLVGLAVVAMATTQWLRAQPPVAHPATVPQLGTTALGVAVTIAAVPTLATLVLSAPHGLYAVAFNTAVVGIQASTVSLGVLCLVWQVLARVASSKVASH
jgi:Domain of unknown function (DUF4184)